jgi:hypothetical protein
VSKKVEGGLIYAETTFGVVSVIHLFVVDVIAYTYWTVGYIYFDLDNHKEYKT